MATPFGKESPPLLIGRVLLTGTRESRCVIYYSMLEGLSQSMGDYDPQLNV